MAEEKTATISTNAWLVASQELDLEKSNSATGEKITLQTAGKWLDRNIEIAAPTAKIDSAEINSSDATVTTVEVGEKSGSSYPVTGSVGISGPTVSSAGYISDTVGTKTGGTASVNATVTAGEVSASVVDATAGSASMSANGFTASVDEEGKSKATNYSVKLTTTAGSAKAKADVKTAGYVAPGDQTETSVALDVDVNGNGDVLYLPEADVTATAEVTTQPSVTLSSETTLKTAASGDYSITVKGTSTKGSAKATAGTTGVGMVSATDTANNSVDVEVAAITDEVVYIQPAAISNATKDTDLSAYTENSSVVVPSEGYLTISEGYIPATKISLDQLLEGNPDAITAIAATDMLQGAVAYNVDGVKITGTIPTVTATVSASDGQTVSVPAGYIAKAQEVKVANGSVTGYTEKTTGEGDTAVTTHEVAASANDQTITISEGWLESDTIIVKGSSNMDPVVSAITATNATATVDELTVGTADTAAGTIAISGTAAISGDATAKTTQAGYSAQGATTCSNGKVSGTATVDATLPLFLGAYTIG